MTSLSPEYALERQRAWLLEHFRANLNVTVVKGVLVSATPDTPLARVKPACRCWSCGRLLTGRVLFADQVDPRYGTRRSNLRPSCREHLTVPEAGPDA